MFESVSHSVHQWSFPQISIPVAKKRGNYLDDNRVTVQLIDGNGNIYVVSHKSHVIQVLSPQGQYILDIGRPGSNPGELRLPGSAAVHREMIYVTDYGNRRISVFKTSGEFVSTFGASILFRPECIAIDDDGFVYVSDSRYSIIKF